MPEIHVVAEALRDAERQGYRQGRLALYEFLADEITLRRVPALPEDGPRTRQRCLEMWQSEATAYEGELTDFHQDEVEVAVDADRIRLHRALCATDTDGSPLRVPLDQIFTVRDGRIVAIEVHVQAGDSQRLRELIRSKGLAHPDVK